MPDDRELIEKALYASSVAGHYAQIIDFALELLARENDRAATWTGFTHFKERASELRAQKKEGERA